MNIFRRTKFNIKNLYVVTTGISNYDFASISVVSLKDTGKKTCRDIISGEKYYIFDNNDSISLNRTYCSNIRPLYKFFIYDNRYENVFKFGTITLDELCMFFVLNNSYLIDVFVKKILFF